jgi:hypothetical protein
MRGVVRRLSAQLKRDRPVDDDIGKFNWCVSIKTVFFGSPEAPKFVELTRCGVRLVAFQASGPANVGGAIVMRNAVARFIPNCFVIDTPQSTIYCKSCRKTVFHSDNFARSRVTDNLCYIRDEPTADMEGVG